MSFKGTRSERQIAQRPLERSEKSKGMVLPFRPLNMAFSHMYYSVDLPSVSAPLLCFGHTILHVERSQI